MGLKTNKCCCGDEVTCTPCTGGVGPPQWQFILSGIAANLCDAAYCAHFNRVWTLSFEGEVNASTECRWSETVNVDPDNCFGSKTITALLQLQAPGGPVSSLILNIGIPIFNSNYVLNVPTPTLDCSVSRTLNRQASASDPCSNRPATLLIVPIGL